MAYESHLKEDDKIARALAAIIFALTEKETPRKVEIERPVEIRGTYEFEQCNLSNDNDIFSCKFNQTDDLIVAYRDGAQHYVASFGTYDRAFKIRSRGFPFEIYDMRSSSRTHSAEIEDGASKRITIRLDRDSSKEYIFVLYS